MELGNFRTESHVAQQSRRDKLRVQQSSTAQVQHLEDYPSNLEQLSVHQGLNPDLIQVSNVRYGNISYNPAMFSSEMLNFATNSQVLLAPKDAMVVHQESAAVQPDRPVAGESPSFANSSLPIPSIFNAASKVSVDPRNCGTWKSIGSQQSCDWIVNYSSGLTGNEGNQNPLNRVSSSSLYLKPGFDGYQDVQSSLTNPSSEVSSQNSQKHYEEMHFNAPPLYQNTPPAVGNELASLGRGSWTDSGNELLLLPTYGDQSNPICLNNASAWIGRPEEGSHQWSGELGNRDLRTVANDSNITQGLSLSLSTVLPTIGEDLHSGTGVFNDLQVSKSLKSDQICTNSKPSIGSSSSKNLGNSCQDMVGSSTFAHRNSSGPLGPFTGYATILKASKFLKPAQQLLDEICSVTATKSIKTCEVSGKVSEEIHGSDNVAIAADSMVEAKGGDSGVSSSTFYCSNEMSGEAGVRSSSSEPYRPEYQQKKAKLLFMQEEVCRRYKQYHQQMQMVVSSFESVAGLNAATPHISLAFKTISRHFRCLKNAISDQLKHIRKALGEDLSSPTTGASSSKGHASTSRLKFIDHGFMKQKSGGGNFGFFEPQQHVWRPQRGLPERSVAILRAWLFEHFLHPYPTDTDKHVLATQTGLSRNQVSNWFINARVRVWKPMVEEIHLLETRGSAEASSNAAKNDGKSTAEGASGPNDDQPTNKLGVTAMSSKQVECLRIGSLAGAGEGENAEQWSQEKRSRVECQIPAGMDGSLMGFMPYQRSGLEIGGLGAVSLTLGLRQSAESQQQQLQQQEHQLRQHFGGQMIHDFVG